MVCTNFHNVRYSDHYLCKNVVHYNMPTTSTRFIEEAVPSYNTYTTTSSTERTVRVGARNLRIKTYVHDHNHINENSCKYEHTVQGPYVAGMDQHQGVYLQAGEYDQSHDMVRSHGDTIEDHYRYFHNKKTTYVTEHFHDTVPLPADAHTTEHLTWVSGNHKFLETVVRHSYHYNRNGGNNGSDQQPPPDDDQQHPDGDDKHTVLDGAGFLGA